MTRLASFMIATALLRRCEQEGGFGIVVARGDESAGTILIVLAERGQRMRVFERIPQATGNYGWSDSIRAGQNDADIDKFLERRRKFDPDLWVLELDVPSAERFAAEITALD